VQYLHKSDNSNHWAAMPQSLDSSATARTNMQSLHKSDNSKHCAAMPQSLHGSANLGQMCNLFIRQTTLTTELQCHSHYTVVSNMQSLHKSDNSNHWAAMPQSLHSSAKLGQTCNLFISQTTQTTVLQCRSHYTVVPN